MRAPFEAAGGLRVPVQELDALAEVEEPALDLYARPNVSQRLSDLLAKCGPLSAVSVPIFAGRYSFYSILSRSTKSSN